MTWVLASLAAQKVLLLLASHTLFLYLVGVLGVSALLLLFFGSPQARNLLFRCFLVVVFVRFALGFAVALNSGADYLFLEQQVQQNDREIEQFQSRIMSIDADANADSDDIRDSVIEFWQSLSLDELNYTRTGYRTGGLLDVHFVTDEDLRKGSSYAVKIGAVTDPARPLPLRSAVPGLEELTGR